MPIFQAHHSRDLLGRPAPAFTQRAQLAPDDLGPAILAVAFGEKSGQPPVVTGRQRSRARGDHLNALGRFAAMRAYPVRQARSEVDAVAALKLFPLDPARRLDRELDGALQHERELVLVVIAEPIGTGRESSQQRFEMSPDETLRERPALLAIGEERRFDGGLARRGGADFVVSRDDIGNRDVGGQKGLERQPERLRDRVGLHGVEHVVAVLDLGQTADRNPGARGKILECQPLPTPLLIDPCPELLYRVVDRV